MQITANLMNNSILKKKIFNYFQYLHKKLNITYLKFNFLNNLYIFVDTILLIYVKNIATYYSLLTSLHENNNQLFRSLSVME